MRLRVLAVEHGLWAGSLVFSDRASTPSWSLGRPAATTIMPVPGEYDLIL